MKPQPRQRRSSASITLVLIGTAAALYGCGEETSRHDVYRTRADCLQDWNQDSKCDPVRSGPHTGFYYGPGVRSSGDAGTGLPRTGSHAVASANVPRGGFGATGSSHASSSHSSSGS
jgi:uncharacterized protein YgiB involved in biofilm formation